MQALRYSVSLIPKATADIKFCSRIALQLHRGRPRIEGIARVTQLQYSIGMIAAVRGCRRRYTVSMTGPIRQTHTTRGNSCMGREHQELFVQNP